MTSLINTALINTVQLLGHSTLKSIYITTDYIINGSHPEISEKLNKLDISNRIKIIEALLIELHENQKYKYKKSIQISLESIHSTITKIEKELQLIKIECDYHTTKYFNYWRTPNCLQNLLNVEQLAFLLNERIDMLREIIKMI